jgi:hypothetical protein
MGRLNYRSGTGLFVYQGIISAVKRVEFKSDRMSYITLSGRWCGIVMNVRAPTECKSDNMKYSIYEELEHIFCLVTEVPSTNFVRRFRTKVRREDIFKPTRM